MKKLYRKGQVHPSPSPPSSDEFSLSYVPAAILTLAAALSSQDKQVLAYLLSCSSSSSPFDFDPCKSSSKKQSNNNIHLQPQQQHIPCSACYCFSCYTSYWARWDASPNRQLIHEIIDAFEDNLMSQRKIKKKNKQGLSRREKRKNKGTLLLLDNTNIVINDTNQNVNHDYGLDGSVRVIPELDRVDSVEEQQEEDDQCDETGEVKQGSVRKIVSFIGERIWGSVWGSF